MTDGPHESERQRTLINPEHLGPSSEIALRENLSDQELQEVIGLLQALHNWHVAAEDHSTAARGAMHLGGTDMRAIRYLIACKREGVVVTLSMLAEHLCIAGPSVTKMLDRLEPQGHVRRMPHPSDRRAVSIEVTNQTLLRARTTIGQDHARRFEVIARLSSEERQAATKVLRNLADIPVIDHERSSERSL